MKILIDADGCPVVDIAVKIAKQRNVECIILCDTSHVFDFNGVEVITVPRGADSVDFKIVNMISENDIIITQDYALAAMCLAKKGFPINQDGMEYTENNIDGLLFSRHLSREVRMAGGRTKGAKKRIREQDNEFSKKLEEMITNIFEK